jgi:FG-GAP-like repeat/Bacterial Ig-like domain (group 3)
MTSFRYRSALALLALLVTAPAFADCRYAYWWPMANLAISSIPNHISAADFTGDGRPDLVTNGNSSIDVALNHGNGTFAAPVQLMTGAFGMHAAGDFTGDGTQDIVLANTLSGSPALHLFANNGNGTFTLSTTGLGLVPNSIAAGDMNGDGVSDIVMIDRAASWLVVLLRGNGTFTESARAELLAESQAITIADLDGDGKRDVAVGAYTEGAPLRLYFGNGTGGLDPAVSHPTLGYFRTITTGDLNGDGRLDLAWIYGVRAVVVSLNLGNRTFSVPVHKDVLPAIYSVELADLTGDSILDSVSGYVNERFVEKIGKGDGTLQTLASAYRPPNIGAGGTPDTAVADFDGDGRIDIAAAVHTTPSNPPVARVHRNRCGESTVTIKAPSLVTVGQLFSTFVQLAPPDPGNVAGFDGLVTLRANDTEVSSVQLFRPEEGIVPNSAELAVPGGLTAGTHTLTASLTNDSDHDPVESAPVTVRTTAETSTTTLSFNPPQAAYGQSLTITANVTSTVPGTPTGPIDFVINNYRWTLGNAPTQSSSSSSYPTGSHTVLAQFLGNATFPASQTFAGFEVTKAQLAVEQFWPPLSIAGEPFTLTVALRPTYGKPNFFSWASGLIQLRNGPTILGQTTLSPDGRAEFPDISLPAGRHHLWLRFFGSNNLEAFDEILVHNVKATGAPALDARGGALSVHVGWTPTAGFAAVGRRIAGGPWSQIACCNAGSFTIGQLSDTNTAPNTVYVYRLQSSDGTQTGPGDVAMRVTFTDDPLVANGPIRAVHMTEIVATANVLRAAAGMAPLALDIGAGKPVRSSDINAIRNGINDARVALGATPFAFTDVVGSGGPVRALHFQELRESLR